MIVVEMPGLDVIASATSKVDELQISDWPTTITDNLGSLYIEDSRKLLGLDTEVLTPEVVFRHVVLLALF